MHTPPLLHDVLFDSKHSSYWRMPVSISTNALKLQAWILAYARMTLLWSFF